MAEEETTGDAPDVGSHPVLSAASRVDESAMALGDGADQGLTIISQMEELMDLLREFGQKASKEVEAHQDPWARRVLVDAEKTLFRMVDVCKRFVNEYR